MRKCTSVQYFQILDKKDIVCIFGLKSFCRSMWQILQYYLLFSSNSDYNLQKQHKTAKHLFLYTLCNMKNALKAFLTKTNGYDAFSLNLRIFNIYLLCIKQN